MRKRNFSSLLREQEEKKAARKGAETVGSGVKS